MDEFLATVGVHMLNYSIRSGIALTSSYALNQCARLLATVDDKNLYLELRTLQKLLDSKIKIISPAIDLVEFKSGRGNVFHESAVPLTKSLHRQVISLGRRIEAVAAYEEDTHEADARTPKKRRTHHELLRQVVADIKSLLDRIDREIPLLQLAITASGESLSSSLPASISPSRLLQASTLLIVGDTQYAQDPTRSVQIGPAFNLSLYMLFLSHASHQSCISSPEHGQKPVYGLRENERKPLWQEVVHKARVRLCRSAQKQQPNGTSNEELVRRPSGSNTVESPRYAYHLEIIEDLDDGRVHDEANAAAPYEGISKAGIRESIPIHQLSKIFYTDTGRMLNVGNAADGENSPVLLLKRDLNAPQLSEAKGTCVTDIREESDDELHDQGDDQAEIDQQLREDISGAKTVSPDEQPSHTCSLPKHLDPEWIALEVYEGDEEADTSETEVGSEGERQDLDSQDREPKAKPAGGRASLESKLAVQIRNLSLQPSLGSGEPQARRRSSAETLEVDEADALDFVARSPFGAITSSLSLIEMLIRLAGLQEVQQTSHLSTPDHILTFFLEDASTTVRQTERSEAKRRVGFDPYTDSPTE
ncbi:Ran-specific GTPase-activating protein 30 [Tolypocladium ophioglossoides CBS 100239]|uniref:Ran-specific GTPase-activating protein 30 n=1 Tax=Tolypocladium ophioglossoides (strain CBS 100239) TaxID=1163406 RepID=A0A0L0N8S3_TOLOC|nr:Ran-specific GTPase-activating protein 30 [Tolypocladium ophioglossoides CBS 100239]